MKLPTKKLFRVTEDEYRANLAGMNTFFGAVLGFVLADIQTRRAIDFAQVLLFTSAIVIGILYVSASSRRWLYAALNLIFIAALPTIFPQDSGDPTRLQITLAVWAVLTMVIEIFKSFSDWRVGRPED